MMLEKRTSLPVFLTSAGLVIFFVVFGVLYTKSFSRLIESTHTAIVSAFGWYFILVVSGFLLFSLWLLLGRYHHIRLGPDNSRPSFSFFSWIAMLFSAGMGIGLLFYGVAEPLLHFGKPPMDSATDIQSAKIAMNISFFHWGLHAWATYIVVGLSLAYFGYRKNLPLTVRSAFYPLIGNKIYGFPGHVIDILAVLGTLFGVATSLGLGVIQVNAGLDYLLGIGQSKTLQVVLIAAITLFATISVVTGVEKGIKRLSEANLILGLFLLLLILFLGPTLFILRSFVENTGFFLQNLVRTMFWTDAFKDTGWQGGWTVFYWAWWISWAPFVGMFVARISRGRTIREFIIGVLFVPTALTFLWLTVFGGSAIHMEMLGEVHLLEAVQNNVPAALFSFLEHFPMGTFTSGVATLVIVTFFITSSDSGSYVIDVITSGGDPDPPLAKRIFWSTTEGVVAAVLLVGGGLKALQTAAITTALPFSVVLVVMCFSLYKSLREEKPFHRHPDT